jgi:hypothetical protein
MSETVRWGKIGPISGEDRAWLKALDERLWTETGPDRFGHRTPIEKDGARLSEDELQRVLSLVASKRLPVQMFPGTFGFTGYSLAVYEHDFPPYPGAEQPPQYLVCLTARHLPGDDRNGRLERAWDTFSPYTHSEENLEVLKHYGMKAPREKSYYEY